MSSFTAPKILPAIDASTASAPVYKQRKPLTAGQRKAKQMRREAWNGKQKHGSYSEHQRVMQLRAEERKAFQVAEAAGEYVPVKRKGKGKKKQELTAAISASKGQFAAFVGDSDEDEEPQQMLVPQVAVPASNKRTWAQVSAVPEVAAVPLVVVPVKRVIFSPKVATTMEPVLPWGGTTGIVRGKKDGWYESDDEED